MFKEVSGKTSMMRIGFAACIIIGSLLSLFGIIAVFNSLSGAEVLIMSGSGLMGTSGFAKAVQSKWERSP